MSKENRINHPLNEATEMKKNLEFCDILFEIFSKLIAALESVCLLVFQVTILATWQWD